MNIIYVFVCTHSQSHNSTQLLLLACCVHIIESKITRLNMKEQAGKGQYKLWVFAAIILLALSSIFTASLTLKSSPSNLSHDFDSPTQDDFDVLEVEEREKVVRRMWQVYSQSKSDNSRSGLPRFWNDAFHAAYENLVSDIRSVRDSAVSEIAKMSIRSLNSHSVLKNIKGSKKSYANCQ